MISINLTIHNKGFLLDRVLNGIKENTKSDFELICVLDGCEDDSRDILESFEEKNKNINMKILSAPNVFETKANNMAAFNSSGEYIIIIQDDMVITENAWDKRILKPFSAFEDIFAVTARTAHNWVYNKNSTNIFDKVPCDNSWSDILFHTDHAGEKELGREIFGIRDSVNRGPLAIRSDIFREFKGFDEAFCPQDMDDHDLAYRVRKATGLRCGCYPIGFLSDQNWGGTRENGSPKKWFLKANQKNTKLFWERHCDFIQKFGSKQNENRKLL